MLISEMLIYGTPQQSEEGMIDWCLQQRLGKGKILIICHNKLAAKLLADKALMMTAGDGLYSYQGGNRVASSFRELHFVGADEMREPTRIRGMRYTHVVVHEYLEQADIFENFMPIFLGLSAIWGNPATSNLSSTVLIDNYVLLTSTMNVNIFEDVQYIAIKNMLPPNYIKFYPSYQPLTTKGQ